MAGIVHAQSTWRSLADYDREIEELKLMNDSVKNNKAYAHQVWYKGYLEKFYENLQENARARRDKVALLQTRVKKRDEQIAALEAEKQKVKGWLLDEKIQRDSVCLGWPYSKMTQAQLLELKNELRPTDMHARARVDQVLTEKRRYDNMAHWVNVPYDAKGVYNARREFTELQDKYYKYRVKQWEDFDSLDIKLSRYRNGVLLFQGIIHDVELIAWRNAGATEEIIREVIKSNVLTPQTQADIKKRIMVIPYLADRYARYQQWMLSDPLEDQGDIEAIRDEILSMDTDEYEAPAADVPVEVKDLVY